MIEIDKVKTGKNLSNLMRDKHISIFDLQMALRLQSPTNIYAWCRGKYTPNADYLAKIAYVLHCKIDDIIATKEVEE